MKFEVNAQVGYYLVGVDGRSVSVGKDKRCSCGGTAEAPCVHIRAVASYLRRGGQRAPERAQRPPALPKSTSPPVASTCPICAAKVQHDGCRWWRCEADPAHYFQWRGEQGGVRAFLTQPQAGKLGAFYELPIDDLDAFRETAARQMFCEGYSPYQ